MWLKGIIIDFIYFQMLSFVVVDMWDLKGKNAASQPEIWTEVIPLSWVDEDICYFAPWKGSKVTSAIAKCIEPDKESWLKYSVKIHGGVYGVLCFDSTSLLIYFNRITSFNASVGFCFTK